MVFGLSSSESRQRGIHQRSSAIARNLAQSAGKETADCADNIDKNDAGIGHNFV
jgi:hypothetical protein